MNQWSYGRIFFYKSICKVWMKHVRVLKIINMATVRSVIVKWGKFNTVYICSTTQYRHSVMCSSLVLASIIIWTKVGLVNSLQNSFLFQLSHYSVKMTRSNQIHKSKPNRLYTVNFKQRHFLYLPKKSSSYSAT